MKNKLKVLRAERDMTQADLANLLAVSRQTINAIEKGKFDPSLPLAFIMSKLFQLSIEAIFENEEMKQIQKKEFNALIMFFEGF